MLVLDLDDQVRQQAYGGGDVGSADVADVFQATLRTPNSCLLFDQTHERTWAMKGGVGCRDKVEDCDMEEA